MHRAVLIVAKCIVNKKIYEYDLKPVDVLIVAKCIVNVFAPESKADYMFSINSSKVYCKSIFLLSFHSGISSY